VEHSARIAPIADRISWATGPGDILKVVPELLAETPPMAELEDGPAILLSTPGPFLTGIVTFLCGCLEERSDGDALVDASEATVREDPAVQALLPLWLECGRPGSRIQSVPALAAIWASSALVSGNAPWLSRLPGPLVDRWRTAQASLHAASDEARYAGQRRIADRLSARLGASISLARASGVPLPAGGLVRRIMTNRLVFSYPHGHLDPRADLAEVAGLLRAPLDGAMLTHLFDAAEVAWTGIRERLAKHKSTPVDGVLHQLVGQGNATQAMLDPVAGAALIRCLPVLVGLQDLRSSGLDARVARGLLSEHALRPLAAAWTDLVGPVQIWSVLSALASLVTPIWPEAGGWQVRGRHHQPAASWSLRLPRTEASEHAVVAVRMSEILDAIRHHGPLARRMVQEQLRQVIQDFPGAEWAWVGDTGVVVFAGPERAVVFAERVHKAIPGPDGILSADDAGTPVAVSPDLRAGVGMAWGPVDGGTDGECTWLDGQAVGTAMALTGRGAPTLRADDPLNIRSAVGQPDGLRSHGIVADASLIEALQAAMSHPRHLQGTDEEVAGVGEDFLFYPVPYWWDDGSRVWVWLELGRRVRGGPAELAVFDRVMFRDIHSRDRALDRSDIQAEPERPAAEDAPGTAQPAAGGGWTSFDLKDRVESDPAHSEDPWASLESGPVVEIDDE